MAGVRSYTRLRKPTCLPLIYNAEDFVGKYPVKTINQLKTCQEIGRFIVYAKVVAIFHVDPWWFPICACRKVVEGSMVCLIT